MRYLLFCLMALCFAGCANYAVMTQERFADISVGTPIATIEKEFGKPVFVRSAGNGQHIYKYMEKINMGTQVIEQRNYFLLVKNGKVIGKYVRFSNPPAFEAIYQNDIFPET